MSSLRDIVSKNYHSKCAVTGFSELECEAAHIIPSSVCKNISAINSLETDPYNCLFLSRNLHILFDKYHWTADVYSAVYTTTFNGNVTLNILVSPKLKKRKLKSLINSYQTLTVNVKTLPNLYVHYQM